MSFEVPPCGSVEGYQDLEALALRKREALSASLETTFYSAVRGEEATPLNETLSRYAGALSATLLCQFSEEERAKYQPTIPAALKLGTVLAERILAPRMFGLSFDSIRACGDDTKQILQYVQQAPFEYIGERPTLRHLIYRYAPAFGIDSVSIAQARHVTALTLLQVEQHRFDTFLDYKLRSFDQEFDAWQATIGTEGET